MKVLHHDATQQSLSLLRVVVFSIWIWLAWNIDFRLFAEIELSEIQPVGVLQLIPLPIWQRVMTHAGALFAIKSLTLVAAIFAACGLFRLPAMLIVCAGATFMESVVRSTGIMSHATISPLYAAYVLTGFQLLAWWRARRDPRDVSSAFPPIATVTMVLCMGYVATGTHRLAFGGPSLLFTETPDFWFLSRGIDGFMGHYTWRPAVYLVSSDATSTIIYAGIAGITLIEYLTPLVFVWPLFRRFALVALLGFHLNTVAMMDIAFFENMILLSLCFVDYHSLVSARVSATKPPIVFFDGVCGLCDRFVSALIRIDSAGVLRFAPLQGATASEAFGNLEGDPSGWAIVYLDETGRYERSDAALRVLGRLGFPYQLAWLGFVIPRSIRDAVYRFVARHRYRVFGKHETCPIPDPEQRFRYLP